MDRTVPAPRDVLLAIGVNRVPGMPGVSVLRYAEADAHALAGAFRARGFPADRVVPLTGDRATSTGITGWLAELPRRFPDLGPGDRVWLSFSGHGITGSDGRTHLLVHDTHGDPRHVPECSVAVELVANLLRGGTVADRILLLDACRNELRPLLKSGLTGPAVGLDHLRLHRHPGLAIFSGCVEGGVSYESPRHRMGLFTAALVAILGGDDLPVTVADLEARLLDRVPREARRLGPRCYQQPSLRAEPHWRAAATLLFPHLLTPEDVRALRHRATRVPAQTAAALWQALSRLDPAGAQPGDAEFATLVDRTTLTGADRSGSELELGRLADLLRAGNWRDADRETARLLMVAAGRDPDRTGNHMITLAQVATLRWADLHALDDLWMRHSDGRFGLTPQLQQLHRVDGDIARFADAVGWRRSRWIFYSEAKWHSGAPPGHLPIIGPVGGIKPNQPIPHLRQAGAGYASLGRVPYQAVRFYRTPGLVERETADITVDARFGWAEYNRLAVIALGDIYASVGRGRLGAYRSVWESPLRQLVTNYTQLLSVVWAVNRVPLLHHYRDLARAGGTAGSGPGVAGDG
ncbi:GUN4 domain-containing protein [Plantactinospora sp. B5E13]|uniref:GUN4 domain-containing protein n=1 Tax=Plantactinospora sp. B5E13 TaxID=3153758 RepID=UPI00325E152D